jgi:hypothetical protein
MKLHVTKQVNAEEVVPDMIARTDDGTLLVGEVRRERDDVIRLGGLPPGRTSGKRLWHELKVGDSVTVIADESAIAACTELLLRAVAQGDDWLDVKGRKVLFPDGWEVMFDLPGATT